MQLHEMEEQLKNLDERTARIEQILPTLATKDDLLLTTAALQREMAGLASKDDLKAFATKHDLKGFATKDDLKAGLEDAKRYTLLLIQATRGEIGQMRREMATKADLAETKAEIGELRREMTAMGGAIAEQVTFLTSQVSLLTRRKRRK